MWFGFFYALAYLFWAMIYFGWRGRWIYEFLDWSKPVLVYCPDLLSALVLVTSSYILVMFSVKLRFSCRAGRYFTLAFPCSGSCASLAGFRPPAAVATGKIDNSYMAQHMAILPRC
jgi:cytochrome c oxidase assembly factor CtaG